MARELGVQGGVVSNVIHGRITAHGVALHIAELLGQTVQDLWPDRYVFKPRTPTSKPCKPFNRWSLPERRVLCPWITLLPRGRTTEKAIRAQTATSGPFLWFAN
ncbi:helix-turn-helix domain-containing protein [Rhodoferax sp.]|uniref:helix-turn-helix domain-containing protein n=1 Tax=Rhodoferax sp. TaxID=50421 RepID=UPI003A0FE651